MSMSIIDKFFATFNFGGKNNHSAKYIQKNTGNTFNGSADLSYNKTVIFYDSSSDDRVSPEDFFRKHILDFEKWKKNNDTSCFSFYFSEKPEYSIVFYFDNQKPNEDYIRLLYPNDTPGWHTVELKYNSQIIYRDFWSEMDGSHGTTLLIPDVRHIKTPVEKSFYTNNDYVWFLFYNEETLKSLLQQFIFRHSDIFSIREDKIAETYICRIKNTNELSIFSNFLSENFTEINHAATNSNFLDDKQSLSDNERHIVKTIKVTGERYYGKER